MKLIQNFRETMNPPVFLGSVAVIAAFVIYGAGFIEHAVVTFQSIQAFIVTNFGWLYILDSDSGSFVDVMVTSGGHPNPPKTYCAFWCITEGVVAATLLIAGGLTALRTASLTPALPMVLFLLIACYGLLRALQIDAATKGRPRKESLKG